MAAADSVLINEETLFDIKREAKRLSGFTEDLLTTAKNTQPTEFVMVELNEVTSDVMNRLAGQAHEKMSVLILVERTFSTYGNKIMLERMIENVVHNAIKFSHDGGTVTIVLNDRIVCISDSGIGMSQENQTHIFERFYTVDSSRNEYNKNGAGLGLSIVRQIADLHKISIRIDSAESRGTVFQFSFLQ